MLLHGFVNVVSLIRHNRYMYFRPVLNKSKQKFFPDSEAH